MKRKFIPLLIAVMVFLGLCAAAAEGNILRFEKTANRVYTGETIQTVLTREGAPAGGELKYSSSSEKTATVDANGRVTGVSRGQATITATVKVEGRTYRAQMTVTVEKKVIGLNVDTSKLPVYAADDPKVSSLISGEGEKLPVLLVTVKKSLNFPVSVVPKDAGSRKITLTSENPGILQVKSGSITGQMPGETILTASSDANPEVFVRYRVLVVQPAKKLTVKASADSVTVGGRITLSASVSPDNATVKQVVWSSADEKIVRVDQDGVVTGISRGNGRIIATAADGSGVRANISVKVVQKPEGLSLSSREVTVDTGRNTLVRATVMPKNADSKKVRWSSSDERVATVSKDGRITGVMPGTCTVTCVSEAADSVSAAVTVHVQQPVKKLSFWDKSAITYDGETLQLRWTTEPANATNPGVKFTSSNEKVATVDRNGIVTGISRGQVYINAVTTDGSNRKARIQVKVGQHVRGVHMVRKHAYIDLRETATAGATLEPKDATNRNMTWVSSDESVVTATGKTNEKMKLKGVGYGDAVVTGTTEDGGYQTSIRVTVGDFDRSLSFRDFGYDSRGNFWLSVRNRSDFTITRITATVQMTDATEEGNPEIPINTKNGTNKVDIIWSGTLRPGETTGVSHWKMSNYQAPAKGINSTRGVVTLCSFQIENDWIKTIRDGNRPWKDY